MAVELDENRAWYVDNVYKSDAGLDKELADVRTPDEWAATTQLLAVANVLRRPVALLASLADMASSGEGRGVATYLPARHTPQACCPHPLLLAWSSADCNHYVPLCRVHGAPAASLPEACRPQSSVPATVRDAATGQDVRVSCEAYIPIGFWRLNDTTVQQLALNAAGGANPGLDKEGVLVSAADTTIQALQALGVPAATEALCATAGVMRAAELPARLAAQALVRYMAACEYNDVLRLYDRPGALDARCAAEWARLKRACPQLAGALRLAVLNALMPKLDLKIPAQFRVIGSALVALYSPVVADQIDSYNELEAERLQLQWALLGAGAPAGGDASTERALSSGAAATASEALGAVSSAPEEVPPGAAKAPKRKEQPEEAAAPAAKRQQLAPAGVREWARPAHAPEPLWKCVPPGALRGAAVPRLRLL